MSKRPGPSPTPTALRVLRGNPGKRPLPKDEPKPEVAVPEPPDFLRGAALAEWQRITPELETLGLLSRMDRATLVAYCQAWGELDESVREIEALGSPYTTSGTGYVQEHPAATRIRKAREHIAKFSALFGLSPADRTRIHATPKEKPTESPIEKLRRPIRS